MKSTYSILAMTVALAGPAFQARGQGLGEGLDPACLNSANLKVTLWKAQNRPADEIERLYQQELAKCSGGSVQASAFVADVNFDLARAARQYLAGSLPSNLYLALSRDRGRKLRKALKDPVWLQAWAAGDSDGDLIPNSRDNCPGTLDLKPTFDNGCPWLGPYPPGPNESMVRRNLEGLGFPIDPGCAGAPAPEVAQPRGAGYLGSSNGAYSVRVIHVNNQPANCMVMYEFRIRYSNRKNNSVPAEVTMGAVFSRDESIFAYPPNGQPAQSFPICTFATGPRKLIRDTAHNYNRQEIKIRVMNGAGITSGWSQWFASNVEIWPF